MKLPNLPPLDLLVPFEASARLGSFTRAAEELAVTQSAVSQRVRNLEAILDIALFERAHRSISLTDEGRELYNGVKVALQHLSAATQSIQRLDERPLLRVAVDISIGHFWLQPRLKSFLERHPAIAIDLSVSDEEERILTADIIVVHGDGTWPGFVARLLFQDDVIPVCSPAYLAAHPIRHAGDLPRADLLDLDYKHWNWMNWGIWLTEAGVDPGDATTLIRTDSYLAQIDAARAGMGVALGWRDLLEEDFARGALVPALSHSIETRFGYYVLLRQGADENAHLLAKHLYNSADGARLPRNEGTGRLQVP